MKDTNSDPQANAEDQRDVFDIIVVGAGLVGASCAALLAANPHVQQQALRIAVIDSGKAPCLPSFDLAEPSFDPRVVALTHASQSLFEHLGLWDGIQNQRACAYRDMHVWDNDGTAQLHFNAQEIQHSHLGSIVENSILQCAVLELMAKQPAISLLRRVGIESLVYNDSGVEVITTEGRVLSAKLLIAADGGLSTVRTLANMQTREWEYHHKAIVATVQSEKSHRYTAWQNFLSTGPLAFLPLDHVSEQYCSIVWSLDTERADELMAADDDTFKLNLGQAFEHRLGDIVSVSQRYCFPLVQRHAVDYSVPSVVLVGDAAHTIHPLAGQGVNLGLLDVQALVAEIDRGLRRDLPLNDPSLLRRYQRQRKGHNLEVMLLMEGLKRLFGSRHLLVRWLRNVGMNKVNELGVLKRWLAKQAIKHHE